MVTHPGTKPSHCVFLGTTNQVLTTGYSKSIERQYSLWDASDLEKGPVASDTIDSSPGVLMPFWDEGTRMFYLIGKVQLLPIIKMLFCGNLETGLFNFISATCQIV